MQYQFLSIKAGGWLSSCTLCLNTFYKIHGNAFVAMWMEERVGERQSEKGGHVDGEIYLTCSKENVTSLVHFLQVDQVFLLETVGLLGASEMADLVKRSLRMKTWVWIPNTHVKHCMCTCNWGQSLTRGILCTCQNHASLWEVQDRMSGCY